MALLRLLHMPSSTHFCSHQNLSSSSRQHFHKPLQLKTTPTFPFLSFRLPVKPKDSIFISFESLFSTQAQPIAQNPDNAERENQEEEEGGGEEFSKTRLWLRIFHGPPLQMIFSLSLRSMVQLWTLSFQCITRPETGVWLSLQRVHTRKLWLLSAISNRL